MNPILRNILLLLLCFVNYSLFQCTIGYTSQNAVTDIIKDIVEMYANLPACVVFIACSLLTVFEIYLIYSIHYWYNTHITSSSIKETVETLPVGICAFESNGKISLRNRTMEQICRQLTGLPLLNGNEFDEMLVKKKSDLTISLPDYGVWSFTKDEICNEKTCFTLLVAYNVTEIYQKTVILEMRKKTVQELNEKLLAYNKQIEHVITQQEILNAKIQIHDELGLGLLAIKRYLVSDASQNERDDLVNRLKENIQFLQNEAIYEELDEYSLILSTAKDLGISVQIDGLLPQTEKNKKIISKAIHECFTNILRHTNGDTLYVNVKEDKNNVKVYFTDNNTKCFDKIVETGGLRSLRDLVVMAGGKMRIATDPQYCLTIVLPKEVERNGL